MLNREKFLSELKEALGMPKDLYIHIFRPVCDITTDELLDDDGFDYKLGNQVFCFKSVDKNSLRIIKDETNFLPQRVKQEVLAILNCRNKSYKGTRQTLDMGKSSSWLCRYYLALDYFEGRDGDKDEVKAAELATHALNGTNDNFLKWVKLLSAKECLFDNLAHFYYNKKDYFNSRFYWREALKLSPNDSTYLNNYGVSTFVLGRKFYFEAFTYFKKAEEAGNDNQGLLYILGICYMFGLNKPDNVESRINVNYITFEGLKEARSYFERMKDYDVYDCQQYAYLSKIYECIGDTEKAEENDKKGADYGYNTAQLNYGKRLIKKAEVLTDYHPSLKLKLYDEGIKYIKAALKGKRAYWFNQSGDFLLERDIAKCLNEAEQSYNSFMRRIGK